MNRETSLSPKAAAVRGYFDAIAVRYDLMNTLLSFGQHHLWKRAAVKAAGIKEGAAIIDVCGGTADLAVLAAAEAGPSGTLLVYDFSREMLRAGAAKCAARNAGACIHPVCGDAQAIACPAGLFDIALIGFGLRNLQDIEKGLQELYRVLKPGGRLVCLEFSQPVSAWFKKLYDLYSFYVIPAAGKLAAGSHEAYAYLPASIRAFPPPQKLAAQMETAGFLSVSYRLLFNGIAALHTGQKH